MRTKTTSFYFCVLVVSMVQTLLFIPSVEARCPDGTHKSPSGDCERVTHSGGLPRCPDGFHRSPDGDCERVSAGNGGNSGGSDSDDDDDDDDNDNGDETSLLNSETPLLQTASECKGSADCFRGTVTEIVDGDTLDVNNVRVRLAMVNTPEAEEDGYDEATDTTESVCPVGSEALVDEDDGQKGGSFGRLIGAAYCNGDSSSVNELLLETDKAVLYEDFCEVSEFASDGWVTTYGC